MVDDNVFNLMTLQCILTEGLKVSADKALNGLEAVNKFKEREKQAPCLCTNRRPTQYRLVFMDCNMPVMDGF